MAPVRRKPRPSAPADVIHGISLDVRGADLAIRVAARIAWHRQRELAIKAQLQQLDDGDARTPIASSQRDAIRLGLERKLTDHQQRAEFLAFLRDHLSPTRVYRLNSMDFRVLDLMPDTAV